MHSLVKIVLFSLLAKTPTAAPAAIKRDVSSTCPSYTIINTRGTGEPQGPSAGFLTMNSRITAQLSGGKIYDTVYPADLLQNSGPGTQDIVAKIAGTLASSPDECFILQGYSQGATATVDALSHIMTGASFDAVKGVFLIGNPVRMRGLECNVDNHGGDSTKNVDGVFALLSHGVPGNWVNKTLDVCIFADGICDTTHGIPLPIIPQHLQYPFDPDTQDLGTKFALARLGD